jgi:hypothetical protein
MASLPLELVLVFPIVLLDNEGEMVNGVEGGVTRRDVTAMDKKEGEEGE